MQPGFTESLNTAALAALFHVRPASIRTAYWRDGHYFGLKPLKAPNGRLLWPAADVRKCLAGEGVSHAD